MYRRIVFALAMAAALALPPFARAAGAAPSFSHVYIIFEENTDYNDVIGNTADAPYINSLAQTYGLAANYYGVTHPSLPNYVAATAGDFFGSKSDSPTQVFDQKNIVDQLESKGLTWAAYMQTMPSVGYTGQFYPSANIPLYVNKHDPFVLFKDILSSPTRLQNVKPTAQLAGDLAGGKPPNYVWITPDQCHDMHGMAPNLAAAAGVPECGYPPTDVTPHALIQTGDQYLKSLVTTIKSSKAWTSDSIIVVTWDENEFAGNNANAGYASATGCCGSPPMAGGGRVPAIVITDSPTHTVSLHPYNHYSLMRTVEDAFGLGCLAHTCDASVQPMTDLIPPTGGAIPLSRTLGFAVSFTSKAAGQGRVLFGSGPDCTGLVQVGTQDLGAGTTSHTVLVTGNDLPGTIGNIGLSPGATYSYEVITVTNSGVETDNNNGKCYSFTVSKSS